MVAGFVNNDRFQYTNQLSLTDATELANDPELKCIQISKDKPDLQSLEILNELVFKQRKDITLRIYRDWEDIHLLKHLPELERFDWDVVYPGNPILPLYHLKKIRHLSFGMFPGKSKFSLGFIKDFASTLESLQVAGDFMDLIPAIPQLSNLKSISFYSVKLPGFEFLEGLPIKKLSNIGSKVDNFSYLPGLLDIKELFIKDNTKILDIDFIQEMYNLEKLTVYYVSKVTRFPKCDHLKHLKFISFFECNRLQDIEELKKLSNCLILVTGNMLPGRCYKYEPIA